MLVSIGAYDICDGTLAGGIAVSDLRLKIDRLTDTFMPVEVVSPVLLDRTTHRCSVTFTVKLSHASQNAAETFILRLDDFVPTSGTVSIETTGPTGFVRHIPNGFLIYHSLIGQFGATTFHEYSIEGGRPTP